MLLIARQKIVTVFHRITALSVIKHFLLYAFGSLLVRSLSMLLVPLNMRKLTPSDYGTLSLLTAFITVSTTVIGLGLRQMLSLEFFHHDRDGQKELLTDMIIIYTTSALPIVALIWHARTFLMTHIFFNTITASQFVPTLLTIFFFFYAELLYQLLQYEQKAKLLTILQIMLALISATITLISLWIFDSGLVGILWAQAASTLIATGTFFLFLAKDYWVRPTLKITFLKSYSYILYGLPFIPGIICSWVLSSSDRWILASYRSMHEVGIYAIADLFAQLFYTMVLVPWSGSYLPYIMQQYVAHPDTLNKIEQKNRTIMFISMIGATCLILIGFVCGRPLLRYLVPPTYSAAIPLILILLLGQTFLLGSYFASTLIQFHKKRFFMAFALALPAISNLLLNLLLIPHYGTTGCSIATLLSYGIYFIVTSLYSRRLSNTT